MNNEALMATAAAKSDALSGLADALEYGTVRVLRIDGVDHIYASDFVLTVDAAGDVHCRGFVVNSTCRSLALDALRIARTH